MPNNVKNRRGEMYELLKLEAAERRTWLPHFPPQDELRFPDGVPSWMERLRFLEKLNRSLPN